MGQERDLAQEEQTEQVFRLLTELGHTGWSVLIIPSPGLFAEYPPQLLVRATREGFPVIERLCSRVKDVEQEIAAEARRLEEAA